MSKSISIILIENQTMRVVINGLNLLLISNFFFYEMIALIGGTFGWNNCNEIMYLIIVKSWFSCSNCVGENVRLTKVCCLINAKFIQPLGNNINCFIVAYFWHNETINNT